MRASVIQGSFPHGVKVKTASPRVSPNGTAVPLPPHAAQLPVAGGQPLDAAVRQRMEAAFGQRFDDVRIHVGPHAQSLGALAVTHGSHIHFAPGQYNPATPQGRQVLAHELAHVVQQRTGRVQNPFGGGVAVVSDGRLEAEAARWRWAPSITYHPCSRNGSHRG